MAPEPEQKARETIDKLLAAAGWVVSDSNNANIFASQGVAIREFPLKSRHGFADYLLYVDGEAVDVAEGYTKISEAGYSVQTQERNTRKKRWKQLNDDFSHDPNELDRDVVAPDQIRKIIQTYRDKLFTEIFPGRTWMPKTLIFAKGEAEIDEHPVDVRPADRDRQQS